MVKRNASLVAALAVLLAGCAARGTVPLRPEVLEIGPGPIGAALSLAVDSGTLLAVFSDKASTTLRMLELPVADRLPPRAPQATVIDRVDAGPPLPPTFGEHVLAVSDGAVILLYLVRASNNKSILKLASRPAGAGRWNLDVLEPAGDPVAVTRNERGAVDLFWAAGSLFRRPLEGGAPAAFVSPFRLSQRPRASGPGAFTAYDEARGSLLAFRSAGAGYATTSIPGAGPVHSSLLAADGRLAVAAWDPRSRRIFLLEERPGALEPARTTVTLCEETSSLSLLPAPAGEAFLFLFDETRRLGGGRVEHDLSLLAPASLVGASGQRYRKAILLSGADRIEGFAAVEAAGALYVLAFQGSLKLLRVGLAGAPTPPRGSAGPG